MHWPFYSATVALKIDFKLYMYMYMHSGCLAGSNKLEKFYSRLAILNLRALKIAVCAMYCSTETEVKCNYSLHVYNNNITNTFS